MGLNIFPGDLLVGPSLIGKKTIWSNLNLIIMKNLVFPAVILLGLMLWGCEQENLMEMNQTEDDPFMPTKSLGIEDLGSETGSISGTVFFAGCKIPIPGVSIAIDENSALSAPDGSFCLEGIPEGTHSMLVCKDDFESCCQEVVISKEIEKKLPVYLTSKQLSAQVNGNVTGDYTGKPMSDLKVVVLNPDGTESKLEALTAFNGSFAITAVPKGERTVIVTMNNEEISRQDIQLNDPEQEFNVVVPETFEFRDNRDGRKYKAIRVGNQTWMQENLAYRQYPKDNSEVKIENPVDDVIGLEESEFAEAGPKRNPSIYGLLYTWDEAKKACPAGWHLPSDAEWKKLERNLGMSTAEADGLGRRESEAEGTKVKSTDYWMDEGNGDNHSGFNVLPAGMSRYGKEIRLGSYAYFWTSTQLNSTKAWFRDVYFAKSGINRLYYNKNAGYSVRCVKNVDKVKVNNDVVIK
jgi:uncharacterized protein (TIGR02145 family)